MVTVEPIRNINDIKKVEDILNKQNERNLLLFTIGTNCGLRISDILALNVGDVKDKNYILITEKKTGKFKKILINSKLLELIKICTKNREPEEPLFITKFGNRLERIGAYYILNKACTIAGLDEKIGTHTLRKTFGYHHYQKFKDVALLQTIFNHSSPNITLKYIGIDQSMIDESYSNFIL